MVRQKRELKLDPVTFEVLKNTFVTIVDAMAENAFRTCYSYVIFNRDYSGTLHDKNGDTVAQGRHSAAVFVGGMHTTVKNILAYYGNDLHPGDVIMTNDPWLGGTHFNDMRFVRPVFYKDELIALFQNTGHFNDVGGPVPGSMNTMAKEFYAEGLRLTPVKIYSKGEPRHDLIEAIANNTRTVENSLGDIRSMAESSAVGERLLLETVDKYGLDVILQAFSEVQDYVEDIARAKIRELPDGVWETIDYIDRDPSGENDRMIKICTKLTIKDDEAVIDFSGSDPSIGTDLNGTYAHSYTAAIATMKTMLPEAELLNSGFFRVIKMVEPPSGSVINASFPTATSGFCSGTYEKQMNSIFDVMSKVRPERAIACSFNMEYLLLGGWDEREGYAGRPFQWYDWMLAGLGGRNGRDGMNTSPSYFGGDMLIQQVEGQERINPVIVNEYHMLTDSGGPGQWRGGVGAIKTVTLYAGRGGVLSYICDRERSITWGIWGGLSSGPMGLTYRHDNIEEHLGAFFSGVQIKNGDSFIKIGQGGGGLGDPLLRDPQQVLEDVKEEWVSIKRAKSDYGVVIKAVNPEIVEYEIDYEATEKERAYIRANRRKWLEEDPEVVARKYFDGEIDIWDVVRKYGVVVDRVRREALPYSSKQYRDLLKRKMVPYWDNPYPDVKWKAKDRASEDQTDLQ